MKIKTFLVDDEPLARQRMRELLAEFEDIEILADFASGLEAKKKLDELKPDLVLLDIQMPKLNGFQLVEFLAEAELPLVVFVTAHHNFALEAFDTRAVDYLLKPVRPERLARALSKVRSQLSAIKDENLNRVDRTEGASPKDILRLMVKNGDKIVFVKNEQIDWIESAGNYVIVHAGDERHIIRETMTTLEKGLPQNEFVRLNRSLIVKTDRIVELVAQGAGEYSAVLRGGKRAAVTIGLRELEQKMRFGK